MQELSTEATKSYYYDNISARVSLDSVVQSFATLSGAQVWVETNNELRIGPVANPFRKIPVGDMEFESGWLKLRNQATMLYTTIHVVGSPEVLEEVERIASEAGLLARSD